MPTIALVGNPNVGKTALFNALTGLSHTTGNYPGVTVERKSGRISLPGLTAELVDLPGAYSLAARSPDEMIVADILLSQHKTEKPMDAVLVVADASNLERNLYLVSQVLELDKPVVVALNMMDIAKRRNIQIDIEKLSEKLGARVVPICAHKKINIEALRQALADVVQEKSRVERVVCVFPDQHAQAVVALTEELGTRAAKLGRQVPRLEAFRILVDEEGYAEQRLLKVVGADFMPTLRDFRVRAQANGATLAAQEAKARYGWVRGVMDAAVVRGTARSRSRSERIDNVLTHRLFGSLIFLGIMLVIFQAIYTWAAPMMDLVDGFFGALGGWLAALLPDGMLESLVVDGMLAGVGSVLIFLPQILMLSLFVALLEDFGYMSRAAFLMDKMLSWCGLSGQSFIPMLSSFACAIPGIMATRTIHDRRDRFTTILVAPLMSCSARLPVYLIMIGAFVPNQPLLGGLLGLQAVTLFGMYVLGVAVAVPVAWILKTTLFKGVKSPFLLEMPSYKIPQASTVANKVYREGREFVVRAGTLIFAVTILVWALAYFPHAKSISADYEQQRAAAEAATPAGPALEERLTELDDLENGDHLRNSFLGHAGQWIEPVFRPLGWDWRIATATIASFPAREIIVATLGTLFNLGADEDESSEGLLATLKAATWPDGRPLFTIPVALSIMVFFALCCQCGATLVTIRKETGQWRWPALTFVYMTTLAYIGAFVVYNVSSLMLG